MVRLPPASSRTDTRSPYTTLVRSLYALLAAGLTLYFGVMRVVMIAHSAFLILAGYLAWFFTTETGLDPMLSLLITVPLFFGIGFGMQIGRAHVELQSLMRISSAVFCLKKKK